MYVLAEPLDYVNEQSDNFDFDKSLERCTVKRNQCKCLLTQSYVMKEKFEILFSPCALVV